MNLAFSLHYITDAGYSTEQPNQTSSLSSVSRGWGQDEDWVRSRHQNEVTRQQDSNKIRDRISQWVSKSSV